MPARIFISVWLLTCKMERIANFGLITLSAELQAHGAFEHITHFLAPMIDLAMAFCTWRDRIYLRREHPATLPLDGSTSNCGLRLITHRVGSGVCIILDRRLHQIQVI